MINFKTDGCVERYGVLLTALSLLLNFANNLKVIQRNEYKIFRNVH